MSSPTLDLIRGRAGDNAEAPLQNQAVALAIKLCRLHGHEHAIPDLAALGNVTVADLRLLGALDRLANALPTDAPALAPAAQDDAESLTRAEANHRLHRIADRLPGIVRERLPHLKLSRSDLAALDSIGKGLLYELMAEMQQAEEQIEREDARAQLMARKVVRAIKTAAKSAAAARQPQERKPLSAIARHYLRTGGVR